MNTRSIVFILAAGFGISACAATSTTTISMAQDPAPISEGEHTAFMAAKPVFEKYCVRCHSSLSERPKAKAIEHVDMTSYPFGGHHASEIGSAIRRTA